MLLKRALLTGLIVAGTACVAQAGWVIEQSSVFTNTRGDESPAEPATMRLSQGRLRVTQPNATTVKDCVRERFSVFVPERDAYWSGTFDEYVSEMNAAREDTTRQQLMREAGKLPKSNGDTPKGEPHELDESKLPKIVIRKTDTQAKIAGYDTNKYLVESDGRVFQEIWMTAAFNLNDDLSPEQDLKCKTKFTAAMQGQSALDFNALYRSEEYQKLSSSGFALKTVIHHIGGTFATEVLSVTRTDVPDSDFSVPTNAQKVALRDLFSAPTGR